MKFISDVWSLCWALRAPYSFFFPRLMKTKLLTLVQSPRVGSLPLNGILTQAQARTEHGRACERPANAVRPHTTRISFVPRFKPLSTSSSYSQQPPSPESGLSRSKKPEMAVHHTTNWKKAFALGGKTKNPRANIQVRLQDGGTIPMTCPCPQCMCTGNVGSMERSEC